MDIYYDRIDAGRKLAGELLMYSSTDCVIFGIPRGGVVVADQIARKLGCPLDIIAPRKIGAPFQSEYAIGAVCSWGNEILINKDAVDELRISTNYIESESQAQIEEANRRLLLYRGKTDPPDVMSRTVIVVDDGIATGYTARAALASLRKLQPKELIFAAPVGAADSIQELKHYADKLVCPMQPVSFCAVGVWYKEFDQTTDAAVLAILRDYK